MRAAISPCSIGRASNDGRANVMPWSRKNMIGCCPPERCSLHHHHAHRYIEALFNPLLRASETKVILASGNPQSRLHVPCEIVCRHGSTLDVKSSASLLAKRNAFSSCSIGNGFVGSRLALPRYAYAGASPTLPTLRTAPRQVPDAHADQHGNANGLPRFEAYKLIGTPRYLLRPASHRIR